jgi:hypothetical protein
LATARWWELLIVGSFGISLLWGLAVAVAGDPRERHGTWWLFPAQAVILGIYLLVEQFWLRRATVTVGAEGIRLNPSLLGTWRWRNITWIRQTGPTAVEIGCRLRVQTLTFQAASDADAFLAAARSGAPSLVPVETVVA